MTNDNHLISHNLLSPQQHGFVPGKSCVSQLITAMDRWTQAYDSGYNTDIIYFDFSKALIRHCATFMPFAQA